MYNDIASDKGYASDDDFEEIQDLMYDYIQHDYSHVAEGDTYGSGDSGMDGTVYEDEDEDDDGGYEAIQSAVIRRIAHSHHELLMKLGPQGVMDAARDIADFAAPVEEIGSSDVSAWVDMIERDAGIEKEEEVAEAKDKVTYDPKTGKLTGWEHEGDWKKSKGKKKDPVGKIHHMSDVARRRTEKMSQDETLEEAFERLVNEDQVSDKLQSFVGHTFYVPAEGQKGTVSAVADQIRFSNSLVVDLANGTTTVVHFDDLKPIAETPGPIKQLWQRLVATVTGGATPKMQPKINAPISDINTPKQFQKLAGIK
jgi:hypothetical protein